MIKDLALETPFFVMLPIILVLLLLFALGIYFAESNAPGSNVTSYGEAVWDAVVLMTTAGTMTEPVTGLGHVLGGIWTILGCMLFYGTIIASASAYFLLPLSSYFLLPRKGEEARLVGTLQYNLGRLERLSANDLQALKAEINTLVDRHLEHH
jgi:voltage-gated potassium channel